MLKNYFPSIILLVTFSSVSLANSVTDFQYPRECQSGDYEFTVDGVLLSVKAKPQQQKVFLLKNINNNTIWLNHPVEEPSASAGWGTKLSVNHWSAFAINQPQFVLTCMEITPGASQYLACDQVLEVCEYKGKDLALRGEGSYWLAENQPLRQHSEETEN